MERDNYTPERQAYDLAFFRAHLLMGDDAEDFTDQFEYMIHAGFMSYEAAASCILRSLGEEPNDGEIIS